MSKRKALWSAAFAAVILLIGCAYLSRRTIAVLQPAGTIAGQERSLMLTAVALGMVVIIPVYILTIVIALRYRAGSRHAKKYSPSWDHSRLLEGVWWVIPLVIITILSVITWHSSYSLDPFKPLPASGKPLTIQVVALDWKWLFLYPGEHIASVNQVHLPINRPVTFDITSDTVMNSFWIPQLGGQIYAMPGMSTELHLMAGKPGTYDGSSANISGNGFAGMAFTAKTEPQQDFDAWAARSAKSSDRLTLASYSQLAKPSRNNPVRTYVLGTSNLFEYTVMKYMEPGAGQ